MSERITNKMYSETEDFQKACEKAGVKATARQASKFRNRKGSAYKNRKRGE